MYAVFLYKPVAIMLTGASTFIATMSVFRVLFLELDSTREALTDMIQVLPARCALCEDKPPAALAECNRLQANLCVGCSMYGE